MGSNSIFINPFYNFQHICMYQHTLFTIPNLRKQNVATFLDIFKPIFLLIDTNGNFHFCTIIGDEWPEQVENLEILIVIINFFQNAGIAHFNRHRYKAEWY